MNYTQTSMNYLNILPPRIRQLVYDFDGRYRIAKGKCLQIIKEMGQVQEKKDDIHDRWSWRTQTKLRAEISEEVYKSRWPNYYAEIQRRVSKYRDLLEDGHIRDVTTHLKRPPRNYNFKDALGYYYLGSSWVTIFIENTAYRSTEKVFTVVMETLCSTGVGTTTVVKRIDLLDPLFIKSIKVRGQKRAKMFRDLGISENGIPGRDLYFEPITIDGKDYFMENKVMTVGGYIRKTRSSPVLGHITAQGTVNWYGDKR